MVILLKSVKTLFFIISNNSSIILQLLLSDISFTNLIIVKYGQRFLYAMQSILHSVIGRNLKNIKIVYILNDIYTIMQHKFS